MHRCATDPRAGASGYVHANWFMSTDVFAEAFLWKYVQAPSNEIWFECVWFTILVSVWFCFCHVGMRHGIGKVWSSLAMIANMSKRSAFLLNFKRQALFFFFFCRNRWDYSFGARGWMPPVLLPTRVVTMWSPHWLVCRLIWCRADRFLIWMFVIFVACSVDRLVLRVFVGFRFWSARDSMCVFDDVFSRIRVSLLGRRACEHVQVIRIHVGR